MDNGFAKGLWLTFLGWCSSCTAIYVLINALILGGQMASIREVTGLTHTDTASGKTAVVTAETIGFFTN
jgi:hypothetical protein